VGAGSPAAPRRISREGPGVARGTATHGRRSRKRATSKETHRADSPSSIRTYTPGPRPARAPRRAHAGPWREAGCGAGGCRRSDWRCPGGRTAQRPRTAGRSSGADHAEGRV